MIPVKVKTSSPPFLVFGYGNPGWQDDGVGVLIAGDLEKQRRPYVNIDYDFQLRYEHAADIAHYEKVLFIDASLISPEPFEFKKLIPATDFTAALSYTSHYISPEAILALCREHFPVVPEAWFVGVKIYRMDVNVPISGQAALNAGQAKSYISGILDEWEQMYEHIHYRHENSKNVC